MSLLTLQFTSASFESSPLDTDMYHSSELSNAVGLCSAVKVTGQF